MKKTIITSIFIFIASLLANSQSMFHCFIESSSADTVKYGDSAWVNVTVDDILPNAYTDTCRIYLHDIAGNYLQEIYKANFWYLMNLPKTNNQIKLKFKIPATKTGAALYSASDNDWNVFVKDSAKTVINTGIKEEGAYKEVKQIQYYDLSGRSLGMTKPETPGIYIQIILYNDLSCRRKKFLI